MASNTTQNVSTAVPQMSTANNQMSTGSFMSTTTGNASAPQPSGGGDTPDDSTTLYIVIPIVVIVFGTGIVVYILGVVRKLRSMWHRETRLRIKERKYQATKQLKKEVKQKKKGTKKSGSKHEAHEKGLQDIQEEDEDLPQRPVKESHVRVGRKMVDMLVIQDLPEPRKEDVFTLIVQTPPGVVPDTSETAEERRIRRKNAWANSRKWAAGEYNKRRDDAPAPPTRGSTAAAARVRPSERRADGQETRPPPTGDTKQGKMGGFMRAIGRMTGRRQQQSLIEEEEIASRGGTPPHMMPKKDNLSLAERAAMRRQSTAASRQDTAVSRDSDAGERRGNNRKADIERANQERQLRRQRAKESRGQRGSHDEDIEEFET